MNPKEQLTWYISDICKNDKSKESINKLIASVDKAPAIFGEYNNLWTEVQEFKKDH